MKQCFPVFLTSAALLTACATEPSSFTSTQPEGASGYAEKPGWATHELAVAAANPLAADAGYQVLSRTSASHRLLWWCKSRREAVVIGD